MNDEVVTDLLGADMINRIGDSTVAAALRRISGISLVNDKFVYVRGLGERYSSATLNGAVVPSPDLTRNVLPMDIFPTSIVEALEVQKSYSAEKHASFGGGSVNIRTKSIPDALLQRCMVLLRPTIHCLTLVVVMTTGVPTMVHVRCLEQSLRP